MTHRHYDVVVLGRSLGALAAAALLARRDFSVLLLGQGQRAPSYRFDEHCLKRRAFSLLFGESPVWQRILRDLAQSQIFRRRMRALEPMFAIAAADRRLSMSEQPERFAAEIRREFPEVQQLVDELYGRLAEANVAIDAALARDAVWPATRWLEKVEASRVSQALPHDKLESEGELLAKFPSGHPYREFFSIPTSFASHLDANAGLPPLSSARLAGSWTRGVSALVQGEDELERFLLERFAAHGGIAELGVKAERIVVEGGRARAVETDAHDDPIGTDAVLTCLSGEAVGELSEGKGITKRARAEWPHLTPTAGRFTVSILAHRMGIPEPLPEESFLLPESASRPDPRRPVVHLQRYDAHRLEPQGDPNHVLLVAEALLPAAGALTLTEARYAVTSMVRRHLPFIDRHLLLIDSTHDGLPLHDFRSGTRREIDRVHVAGTQAGPEFMEYQWTVEPHGLLGIAGESVRGPVPGTFLVGPTTLPGLGQEGELVSAWSVTRLLTQRDAPRQRRRRQLWTKFETG